MKRFIYLMVVVFGMNVVAEADSWALPTKTKYCSENNQYCVTVEPKKLTSQLSYFKDKVDGNKNAGADKARKGNYCKGTFVAKGRKIWKVQLDNEVAPVSAIVSNDGMYFIAFDNWHRVGYGDNVVTIYDGLTGKLIRKLSLEDFLTENDIYNLPTSTSSIWWHGIHSIDYKNRLLVLEIVKPGIKGEFTNVHIDLKTGEVLDEVVDRIPSLQFLHVSDYVEESPPFPVRDSGTFCHLPVSYFRMSDNLFLERLVESKLPEYPPAGKAVAARGFSVFELAVSGNGDVECVRPISGHPVLWPILLNSIKDWKFEKDSSGYSGRIVVEGRRALKIDGVVVD